MNSKDKVISDLRRTLAAGHKGCITDVTGAAKYTAPIQTPTRRTTHA